MRSKAVKQGLVADLRTLLPQTGATQGEVSGATTEALAGFVSDFPHPQHRFTLDVSATAPVTAEAVEAAADSPMRRAALLRQLDGTASYTGAPR